MENEEVNKFIQSFGILSEAMYILYSQLLQAGFDDGLALYFTNEFMIYTLSKSSSETTL